MTSPTTAVPEALRYTASHEWVRLNADGTVTIGITDHAQQALGDVVFAETPVLGRTVVAGEACAVIESVKAASEAYAPLAGVVTGANAALAEAPEAINRDPYGEGWLYALKPADPAALSTLLDAPAYGALIAESAV